MVAHRSNVAFPPDDIVMRRQDDGDTGTFENIWYHITDTLFSTVAIINENANLVERVSYDAYGNARHHRAADLTGDGAANSLDQLVMQANWGNYGVGDLNRDGVVNSLDQLELFGHWGNAQVAGELSMTDNIIGYAGYIFNAEVPGYSSSVAGGLSAGLYTVRHRHYAPDLGRWLSRDPLGYVDGMSLYEYVRGAGTSGIDPLGLEDLKYRRSRNLRDDLHSKCEEHENDEEDENDDGCDDDDECTVERCKEEADRIARHYDDLVKSTRSGGRYRACLEMSQELVDRLRFDPDDFHCWDYSEVADDEKISTHHWVIIGHCRDIDDDGYTNPSHWLDPWSPFRWRNPRVIPRYGPGPYRRPTYVPITPGHPFNPSPPRKPWEPPRCGACP